MLKFFMTKCSNQIKLVRIFQALSRKISSLLQWTSLHEMEEVNIPVQR